MSKIAGGAPLRLDDIVNFLRSDEGRETLESLNTDLRQKEFLLNADPFEASQLPEDRFQDRLLDSVGTITPFERCAALPMAVAELLAPIADSHGEVTIESATEALGKTANLFLLQIQQQIELRGTPNASSVQTKYLGGSAEAIDKIARSAHREDVAARMPLLAEITRMMGGPEAMAGFKMASMGHLFHTTPALYEELERNGIPRSEHLVTGKGYSRDPDVMIRMGADGWLVDKAILTHFEYDGKMSMEERRAIATLTQLFEGVDPKTSDQQFMLLDEGSYLIVALHEHFPEFAHLCHAVEQTDHGIQRIEEHILDKGKELLCPVVNAARSNLKKQFESPMIGEAVMTAIEAQLAELSPDLTLEPKEAAIIGFGAVNGATIEAMRRRGFEPENIWIWDTDPNQRALAKEIGFKVGSREEVLAHGQLMISATGDTTITPDEYDLLPDGAILVNAGSGNHELGMNLLGVDASADVAPLEGRTPLKTITHPEDVLDGVPIVNFMNAALDYTDSHPELPRKVTLYGYDENAKVALAMLLGRGFKMQDVRVYDDDPKALQQARDDGLLTTDDADSALRHGQMLITNAPKAAMTPEAVKKTPVGVIVVNHHELEKGQNLGRAPSPEAAGRPVEETNAYGEWQSWFRGHKLETGEARTASGYRHRVMRTGHGSKVLVLRSGFVVNMTTGIVPEYVQLILGMLQASVLQAAKETRPGLHDVDAGAQTFIRRRTEKHLDDIGKSLTEPSFKGLEQAVF